MKNKYISIILIFIMLLSLVACNNGSEIIENEAINQVGKANFYEKDVIAVIFNDLNEQNLDIYRNSIDVEYYGDYIYESALIIPRYNGMKIAVYAADMNGDDLVKGKLLYETKNKENYGFLLHHERPEGIPLIITIEGNGMNGEYYYAYNGKDGTPEIEYIKIK